jgi:hypothetical protein
MILRPYIKYYTIYILFMLKFCRIFVLGLLVFPLWVRPPVFATRFSFFWGVYFNHLVFLRVFSICVVCKVVPVLK